MGRGSEVSGQTNTCEGCKKSIAPLETYGRYPVNLCFVCWTGSDEIRALPITARITPQQEAIDKAERKVNGRKAEVRRIENELDEAKYALSEAKSRLVDLLAKQKRAQRPTGALFAFSTS